MKKLLTLIVLFVLASCKVSVVNNFNTDMAIAFEILKQETYGGPEQNGTTVVTSQQQLQELYNKLGWNDIPQIDFTKNNVVALFMGEKRTGGYSIGIKKVTIEGNTAIVTSVETKPQEGHVTMAITSPYCIALIPKTQKVTVEKDM